MISMCGNCSAKVVSVMDGQRPQIRCEGPLACSVQRSRPICERPYSIYLVRRRSNLDGCAAVDVDDLAGDES